MKIIRYQDGNGIIGYAELQTDGSARRLSGDIFGTVIVTDEIAQVDKVLAPIVPTTVFCIGLNYRKHAIETNASFPEYPVVFLKGANVVQHPGDPILLPRALRSEEVDYEAELAVVIAKTCKNVSRDQALDYVLGYTCANDVSARDWQMKGGAGQWCRGKTFDTFAPMGPCLVTADEITNPNALQLRCVLNGETMQETSTEDMIFDVPRLIEYLSGSTTLLPGTIILTGTPSGVGMARKPPRWLVAGDTVTIEIDGIGALTNPVREEVV